MRDTTNDENVITACRLVKTCGRAMYEDDPDQLDEQIDRITSLSKNPPPTLTECVFAFNRTIYTFVILKSDEEAVDVNSDIT